MANASTPEDTLSTSDGDEGIQSDFSPFIAFLRGLLVITSGILSVFGNILCIVILVYKKCSIPENNRLLMIAVSAADFGIASIRPTVLTIVPVILGYWPYGSIMCRIQTMFSQFFNGTSIFLLLAVSIDRYIAISKPLRYPVLVTRRRILLVISAIWLTEATLCCGMVPVVGPPIQYSKVIGRCTPTWRPGTDTPMLLISLTLSIIVPFVVMIFIYVRLFIITKKQLQTLQKMVCERGHNPPMMISSTHSDRKTSRIFFSITAVFALSWFPYTIVVFYQNLAVAYAPDMIQFLAVFAANSSSWLDVLTVAIMSLSFRHASKQLLLKICPRRSSTVFALSPIVDNTSKDTFDVQQYS